MSLFSLLPLLAGCDFYPEAGDLVDSGADVEGVYGDCDPVVTIPTGALPSDGDVPADAHADALGSEPAPRYTRYQWPDTDPSRSAAFLWNTDVDTMASLIQIGEADGFPDNAEQVEGYSFLFGGGEVGEGPYRVHEVRLCGTMTPNTTYSYRVGGEGAWSETFTFTTPGEPGSFDTFTVAIAGDSRGAYTTWEQIITKMDSYDPDFIMFSGDMVELGGSQSEWELWLAACGDVIARRPFLAAHGNHEFLAQNYFAQFAFPNNEEWYTIEYGNLLLMSLNDTVQDANEVTSEQPQWLQEVLSGSEATWKFAMHHQPAYSTCTRHGSDLEVRKSWVPVWEQYNVDAVFAGHNHIYERSVPIRADAEDSRGVTYVVTGGAGAPLYTESESDWFGNVANPIEHYIIADVGPDAVSFVVRDLDDNVIDSFTLSK